MTFYCVLVSVLTDCDLYQDVSEFSEETSDQEDL